MPRPKRGSIAADSLLLLIQSIYSAAFVGLIPKIPATSSSPIARKESTSASSSIALETNLLTTSLGAQEAAINHSTVSELVADILKNNGLKDVLDIETVDWETFLVDESAIPTEE
ncbi:hypothetical protein H6G97_20255 [Nostoc flagelliforme FACHB-838]|uniref:Uncharacterized protein n=1 Tax=Nostoc flagelliforme FACHB-838 TaxID=2692904 RepID=A0ABR8DQV4_9NOSO|nr:hypothetical protein [Nostoc flagelliforme]MBD2531801.1 hypothetical protein [Nostoc flagelliforme FACHB-838]